MNDGLEISVCVYPRRKLFDVMLRCPVSGYEVTLTGTQKFTEKQLEFLGKKAPPCVWTPYVLHDSEKDSAPKNQG